MRLNRIPEGLLLVTLLLSPLHGNAEAAAAAAAEADTEQEGGTEAPSEGPTLEERLDALLSEVSAYEDREPQRCLNTRTYRSVKVLNTEYLLFSRGKNKYWLNKLKQPCPPLQFHDVPVFEQKGTSSLCENDPFYPTNSMDLSSGLNSGRPVVRYGTCFLGKFEEISPEQVALLEGQN